MSFPARYARLGVFPGLFEKVFFLGVFLRGLCAAAGHLRGLASPPAPAFLRLAGVDVMLYAPGP